MKKRGVSNIIAIIVIILVCISLVIGVWSAIKSQVKESSVEAEKKIYAIGNINLDVIDAYIETGTPDKLYIIVENKGQQDITSFIVRVTGTNGTYLNDSIYLPNKEKLGPLNTRDIIVIPAPAPSLYGQYVKIEVYPKFEYEQNGKITEEIAATAKGEVTFSPGGTSSYGTIPVVPIPVVPIPAVCGNRVIETGEECDDGNLVNGDNCSAECKIEIPVVPEKGFPTEKIKAAYTYDHSTGEAELNELKSHGINAFIIKGNYGNNINYSTSADNLPGSVKNYASWAKQKDMMFFQALNFVHFTTDSKITTNNVVYSDGTSGVHVSPWDETYWKHLTKLVVNLANLSIKYPNQYRIDGVWFDFELYGNPNDGYFTKSWGFEDSTFNKYLTDRNLQNWNNPPKNPGQATGRYSWLQSNGKLNDYYLFLEETIKKLAENLKNEVKKVNSDFLIGAYPSPIPSNKYLSDIYAGWSNETEPAIIWATEMYNTGGARHIPSNLSISKLPEGYYNFKDVYGKEIYAYYIGGMINYMYPPTNWAYNLYNVAKNSSGFWIYTAWSFTENFADLPLGYQIGCYNFSDNSLNTCENQEQYTETVNLYYQQMDIASEELDKLIKDENYQTYLTKIESEPNRYITPVNIPANALKINIAPIKEQWPLDSLSLVTNPARFRNQHNFIIKAKKDDKVEIKINDYGLGSYVDAVAYKIVDSELKEISSGKIAIKEEKVASFIAPNDGYYALLINPGTGTFFISSINEPMMLYVPEGNKIHLIRTGNIYFWVGSISHFNIEFEGEGTGEGLTATISKPTATGYQLVTSGSTTQLKNYFSLGVNVSAGDVNKIWKLTISAPPSQPLAPQGFEDVLIDFDNNIPPYFSLIDNESYFMR